jgi:hypothetical protein
MITLAPKQTHDDQGNVQNSFPDDAPPEGAYSTVRFDGTHYLFYEAGEEVPGDA